MKIIQYDVWVGAEIRIKVTLMECVYCFPSSRQNDILMINKQMNTAQGITGFKLIAEDINAPRIYWSTVSAPNYLLPLLESIL